MLHIGPHKTGTTALQAACWAARESLLEQGVRYAGRSRHSARAVRAVVGRASTYSDEPPPMGAWHRLAREIRGAREPRLVVSSEYFALAGPETIRRIMLDLGPAPVHIAITLRPLGRIMPSMWQQGLQAGGTASIDAWVRRLLTTAASGSDLDAAGGRGVSFWTLHRHDRLVGVHEGTLRTIPAFANRSLTLPEAEAIRVFNKVLRKESPGKALQAVAVRLGAAQQLKRRQPEPDEERVRPPSWGGSAGADRPDPRPPTE